MRDGFININKAPDMTSHDVVNIVRRILNNKKVGHAGTLDPFATGVLPVAVGRATKFIEYLADCDKSYRAEILFGVETVTGDVTGEILNRSDRDITKLTSNSIDEVLNSFIGKIQQTPPKYSAIKVNGRKAYELARKNVEFEIPAREVEIYKLEVINKNNETLTIDVDCSKGTYIRALAVDIGKRLGTVATLKNLQRTQVGKFSIANSITIDELKVVSDVPIIAVDKCIEHLPKINLPEYRLNAFCNGLSTRLNKTFNEGLIFRVYCSDKFIGTGKIVEGELKSAKIFIM